jgi:hypothetical protein
MEKENHQKEILTFLQHYFEEIDLITEFHLNFFIQNGIETIDLELLLVEKFIFQAFNFFKSNSELSFSRFLLKLYLDISSLLNYYSEFKKNSSFLDKIFEEQFLNTIQEYRILKKNIEANRERKQHLSVRVASLENEIKFFTPKNNKELKELKHLKGSLVDAIHYLAKAREDISEDTIKINNLKNSLKDDFKTEFKNFYKSHISKFRLVLNSKLYYFNKKMWLEINKNSDYVKEMGIKMNLTQYIKNYLKHIDIQKSPHYEEFVKIEQLLKELDE